MSGRILWEGIRLGLASIRGNKLRSFLTLLANVVAVTSVIAVVSVLGGMNVYVKEKVANEGSGVLTLTRVDELAALSSFDEFLASKRNPKLKLEDAEALARTLSLAEAVSAELTTRSDLAAGKYRVEAAQIRGVTEKYMEVRNWTLVAGRHLAAAEVRRAAPVTVIGWDTAEKLFPGVNPLEREIEVRGRHLRVIGIVERRGSILGQSQDLFAILPMGLYLRMFGYRQSVNIAIKARDLGQMERARDEVIQAMRLRHRLRPAARNDFAVTTSDQLITVWEKISGSIFLALQAVASISLVVGGIVIMNIMLVAVTERTREIGLRMALGARRRTVLWQFLVESVTFSSAGGVLGLLAGFLVAALIAQLTPLPYSVQPSAVVAGIGITALTGLVFGIYPAWRAARLDPIEALRHE